LYSILRRQDIGAICRMRAKPVSGFLRGEAEDGVGEMLNGTRMNTDFGFLIRVNLRQSASH
jgi:hypothetical protein